MPDAPVRYCHGCQQYDTHPRVIHAADLDPANDRLYHYDCVPAQVAADHALDGDHPAAKATKAGKRGDDVAEAVLSSELIEKKGA